MKKSLFAVVLFSAVMMTSIAMAQTGWFFETQSVTPSVHEKLIVNAGGEAKFDDAWGVRFFTLMNSGWSQAYVGPVWMPVEWLKLSVGAGGRQSPDGIDLQTAYMVWVGVGRFSFTGSVEVGRLAYAGDKKQVWYDLTARVQVSPWLTLGWKDRRPVGVGPLVEFKLWNVTAWFSYAPLAAEKAVWDTDTFMVGMKIGM